MFGNVSIYWLNVLQLCRGSLVKLSHSSSWHWLAVYCSVQHAYTGIYTHYVPLVSGYRSAKYWPNISQSAKVRTCIAATAQLLRHQTLSTTVIIRFNSVKNIKFFWENKKTFLTYWKTVFWVTEHFCRKWTFWKNVIFYPKNAFFLTKMAIWPTGPPGTAPMSRNFFSGR